jgi:hypothetical protein
MGGQDQNGPARRRTGQVLTEDDYPDQTGEGRLLGEHDRRRSG